MSIVHEVHSVRTNNIHGRIKLRKYYNIDVSLLVPEWGRPFLFQHSPLRISIGAALNATIIAVARIVPAANNEPFI